MTSPGLRARRRLCLLLLPLLALAAPAPAAEDWQALPAGAAWQGLTAEIPENEGALPLAIGYPAAKAEALTLVTSEAYPPGVYQLRLHLAVSHSHESAAWGGHILVNDLSSGQSRTVAAFPAIHFRRRHVPEARHLTLVHRRAGPLKLQLVAQMEPEIFARYEEKYLATEGAPELPGNAGGLEAGGGGDDGGLVLELEFRPDRHKQFYAAVTDTAIRRLSGSGMVVSVERDKILYDPGETVQGRITLRSLAGSVAGTLEVALERGLDAREVVQTREVTLAAEPTVVEVAVPLSAEEFGHALAARFVSADGQDAHERREYFGVAENFMRVAIPGGFGGHGFTKRSEEETRAEIEAGVRGYGNYWEWFAWAEEDMVELTPETDYWFSGQTCYHLGKEGAKRAVRLAHERGVKVVTYGKFVMSGYLGWKYAYDYPFNCKNQYNFPVGMWEALSPATLERFRYKEFVPYTVPGYHMAWPGESTLGHPFWQSFLPINPDPTPRMVRVAAEEMVGAVKMFGFDAVRWDGHPRRGRPMAHENYNRENQQATALLVRYFKDIVAQEVDGFRHGYNCLPLETGYEWGIENYELTELCRGGGLIMNEAQGNAIAGKTYEYRLQVLRTDGDLCRERGGFLLGTDGTHSQKSFRDMICEAAIKTAAGCRGVRQQAGIHRFLTRYSRLVYDERLRRLAAPQHVLQPTAETNLQWDLFVYETPRIDDAEALVVHLLNVPLEARWTQEQNQTPDNNLPPPTRPVDLQVTLPEGYRLAGATLLDPFAMRRTELPLTDGRLSLPAIGLWEMLILSLQTEADAPRLHERWGPPVTLGKLRDENAAPQDLQPLNPEKEIWEVNRRMTAELGVGSNARLEEDPALPELSMEERNERLLAVRQEERNQPARLVKGWWKGGSLPSDLKRKENPPRFEAELRPRRNGSLDVFLARGALVGRLRPYEALALAPRFRVQESTSNGRSVSYHLSPRLRPADLAGYDCLFFADVPHSAIGTLTSYALVDYVRQGGGILFTGGDYAFGKGGYIWTILDRELLPVQCTEVVDTRYVERPLPLQTGPDWAELDAPAPLPDSATLWVWNQAALRPGAEVKVFLKSGNRPILVGWQLGEGRVACLLASHKGRPLPEEGLTPFYECAAWPGILQAALRWCSPGAETVDEPPPPLSAERVQAIRNQLEADAMDALIGEDVGGGLGGGEMTLGDDGADAGPKARPLSEEKLRERARLIRMLVTHGGPAAAELLTQQLAAVANLPLPLQGRVLDALRLHRPAILEETAERCLGDPSASVRGAGYQLLALSGSERFPEVFSSGPGAMETSVKDRRRYLACALALYEKPLLREAGERRLQALNELEAERTRRYTNGQGFSLAAPAQPMLDSEDIFERLGWLIYLSRFAPETHGAQFAREWLMLAQYEYYCRNNIRSIWDSKTLSKPAKQTHVSQVRHFVDFLQCLDRYADPRLEALVKEHPETAAAGFAEANFYLEARRAISFLGARTPAEGAEVLAALTTARQPLLRSFAAARAPAGP